LGFFLYKWSKNKQKLNNVAPILGNKNNDDQKETLVSIERSINVNNHGEKELSITATKNDDHKQEIIIQIPRDESMSDREVITEPVINENYNHGQEANNNGHEASNEEQQIKDINALENLKVTYFNNTEPSKPFLFITKPNNLNKAQ
jgi:hypothetical protein